MTYEVIAKIKPYPDSQYRLLPCKCGSDNVAYEHYNGRGGAKWRVKCFDCGHTIDNGNTVRHDAQLLWNGGTSA